MRAFGANLLDWLLGKVYSTLFNWDSNGFLICFSKLIMVLGLVYRQLLRLVEHILNSLCKLAVVASETPFAG